MPLSVFQSSFLASLYFSLWTTPMFVSNHVFGTNCNISAKVFATICSLGITENAMAGSSLLYVSFRVCHTAGKSDSSGD